VGIRAQFSTEINVRIGMEPSVLLARFGRGDGADADFRPVGYLFLLTTEDERFALHDCARVAAHLGLDDVVELDRGGARIGRGLRPTISAARPSVQATGGGTERGDYGFAKRGATAGRRDFGRHRVEAFLMAGGTVTGVRTAVGRPKLHRPSSAPGRGPRPWARCSGSRCRSSPRGAGLRNRAFAGIGGAAR